MRYEVIPFGSLLKEPIRNGLTKPKAIRGQGVKMIAMGEIFANPRIGFISMDRVPVTEKELDNCDVKAGDLLFARQSLVLEGAGKCSIITAIDEPTVFESHLIRARIDSSKANPYFLYYYFNSYAGRENIKTIVEQVAAAGIRGSDLIKLDMLCPMLEIQNYIAEILNRFDEKIELNQKINENLERQAQAIFQSWFVNHEPWNGIQPSKWISAPLGTFVEIKRGGSPRPIQDYLSDSGLRWLKISDVTSLNSPFVLQIKEHIKEAGLKKTVFLKAGELVLSNSATPGIPKILDVDSCIHDGWLYFPKSEFSKYYLYLFLKHIRSELIAFGNGSVFTNLKTDILKGFPATKADEQTLKKFDALVAPLFEVMLNTDRENLTLTLLRDTLLPKLMSGEINVSDAQCLQGEKI